MIKKNVILIIGGAGYIGSHMVKYLRRSGFYSIVVDDLSNSCRDALLGSELIFGNINNKNFILKVLQDIKPDAVIHFAGRIQVGESVNNPSKYYNNVTSSLVLIDAMVASDIKRIIFSSSAAIFGNPISSAIDEQHPKDPINPYGRSKWMIEKILEDYDLAYDLKSICLRYFNAAGADAECELGECHNPETHLIPLLLQVASGRKSSMMLFGDDYNTPDGSCIRDYIHVEDLCSAHLAALNKLLAGGNSDRYNLGNGTGFSVKQVVASVERVTGKKINIIIGPRREGDSPKLIANASKAKVELGWQQKYSDLDTIVQHAWNWELKKFKNNI